MITFSKAVAIIGTVVMPLAAGASGCPDSPAPDNKKVAKKCVLSGTKKMAIDTTYVVTVSFHTDSVKPGTYSSCGGWACSWYKTKKNPDSMTTTEKLLSSGGGRSKQTITLTSKDKAFTTSGCGPWY